MLYDGVSLFSGGMDSDKNPLLLEKSQASFISNGTVRGGFLTDRPPVYLRTITWPSEEVRLAVEQGLFQGSVYYQPDSGPQSLIASISGRLFQFTIVDNTVTAREITIPGDPNPATVTQVWMWQSENYVIVQDGLSLPIFFDGVSSRRSFGPTVIYNNTTVAVFTPPPIGESVAVTLTAPYTGPYNVPVLFHGAFYQAVANATASYTVKLTTIYSPTAGPLPADTEVVIEPQNRGYLEFTTTVPAGTYNPAVDFAFLHLTAVYPVGGGDYLLQDSGGTWRQFAERSASSSGKDAAIRLSGTYPTMVFTPGTPVQRVGSAPNVLIGKSINPIVIPAAGGSVNVELDGPYSGAAGEIVFAGGVQFFIEAVPPPAAGTTLTLINLTDAGAATLAISLEVFSVPELPAGRMGAYGHSQNWMSLVDGLSFIAGDVSRGPSGTPAYSFRDAVLKVVDSTFVGGNFAISGAGYNITSMTFTANLDVALGQGPLQIGTPVSMFSVLAPFDFTNPPTSGPIVAESLKGYGPTGQNSTINANSDIIFRSNIGDASFILGRRDFNTATNWGNTPISSEMTRTIALDDQTLLAYGSKVVFDNRLLSTSSPQPSPQGVIHPGATAMNLDPVSSLRGKEPPVYDGLWTGPNTLKYDKGIFGGVERAFAWSYNVPLSKIELYELMPTGDLHFDNGTTPITWAFETAALFNGDVKPIDVMASLRDGEMALGDVVGSVRVAVSYRADNFEKNPTESCWTPWHSFSICADRAGVPQYFPRLGLGEPSARACDAILNTPARDGYAFQVRCVITGHATLIRLRLAAVTVPTPKFAPPICS